MRSVIFDIGGVIFNNGTNKFIRDLAINNHLDESLVREVIDGELGGSYREGKITGKEFGKKTMEILDLKGDYINYEKQWIDCYTMIEGTWDIVKKLQDNGYDTYYLSNNVKERVQGLDLKFGFLKLFKAGVFAHELGFKKPHPKAFEIMIQRLDLKVDDCVYIDDSEKNLPPAASIGLTTLFFTSPQKLKDDLIKMGFKL